MKYCLLGSLLLAFTATLYAESKPSAVPKPLAALIKIPAATAPAKVPAVPVDLSVNGKALMPVVVSDKASDTTKKLAQTLADYLQKISGGDFKVEAASQVLSSSTKGIVIGLSTQFSDLANQFDLKDPTKTEDYLLRSHMGGVLLVGSSDLAVKHAVWDFLYQLGYRQFFPGQNWEVIPDKKNLDIAVSTFEHPDYFARRIWPNYGAYPENIPKWAEWDERNRMALGITLYTGHAYDNIIKTHKAEFEKHPEYLTKPGGNKFCVSNPGLQQLVINYALAQFEKNPNLQSVSMEPSDGGGWKSDSCPDATAYKSVTDRVVTLANLVAQAVNKKFPDKFVGIYAYNEHSPPPTIQVDPHVIPSIATAFIHGGFTVDQLLEGWSKKASHVGIREYYWIYQWHRDLPGAESANIAYLATTIPHFHARGARFMNAESGDNWGPNGLGYYIASRLLWDTSQAADVDSLVTDFLDKAFGDAKVPMRHFYELLNGIDGKPAPPFSEDYIGRLYRTLDQAQKATTDTKVLARIHDLALYVRYLELYWDMTQASAEDRQSAFNDVLSFTWRIRETQMVHTKAVWRVLTRFANGAKVPAGSGFRVPEAKDPLKSSTPFTIQDIRQIITEGIANNKLREFETISFSEDLVKADALHLQVPTQRKPRTKFMFLRGNNDLLVWLDGPTIIKVRAGILYTNRGDAKLSLHYRAADIEADGNAETLPARQLQAFEVPPDKEWHEYSLQAPRPGIYVLRVSDSYMATLLDWPQSTPVTVVSTLQKRWVFRSNATLYFYVPKGTKTVGGLASGTYRIHGADGRVLLTNKSGHFNIPVPAGQDGKLWELGYANGSVALMTVPPFLARSPQELLLPKEVVEADKAEGNLHAGFHPA
jgi:hypothetical protein